jgi:hypothetical protein
MKIGARELMLTLAVLLGELAGGCSSGAHSSASHPIKPPSQIYLAQAVFVDCKNSMECCIKKFPTTAAQSCGATAAEIASVLNGARVLSEATQPDQETTVTTEDEFANNRELPEWKQVCIRNYVACQNEPDWKGPCFECLRRCEGQQEWPFEMCWPPGKKGK